MKKIIALTLSFLIVLSVTSCSFNNNESKTVSTKAVRAEKKLSKKITDNKLKNINFKGIVYITKNGKPVYKTAVGKDEKGKKLKVSTTMYIGSVSKQFCATAVMMLRDKGKLSVNDTLDKYFPEYKYGKKITVKNLLTMRSGLKNAFDVDKKKVASNNSEKKNCDEIKKSLFNEELTFTPDSKYEYNNINYFLLADIVEQISGKRYISFIRENIFKPLGMKNSGFVDEVRDNPKWAKSLSYETFSTSEDCKGVTKGAGDIASNAYDMDIWMTALPHGKIISKKTFKEMTQDYSPDSATKYGYALEGYSYESIGHSGHIGSYFAKDYINEKHGYNLFIATTTNLPQFDNIPNIILKDVLE